MMEAGISLPTLGDHRRTVAPGNGVEVLPLSHPHFVTLGLLGNGVRIRMVKGRNEKWWPFLGECLEGERRESG